MQAQGILVGERPRFVLHPVLLAAAYVLGMALPNEAEPAEIVRPLGVAVAVAIILFLLGWAAFRNRWDGALAATIAILLIVSLVPLLRTWTFLRDVLGPGGGMVVIAGALVGAVGGLVIAIRRALRQERPLPRPSSGALNAFAAALFAVIVIPSVVTGLPTAFGTATPSVPAVTRETDGPPPDIVVILLDGYPRADVLERRFGIENRPFLDALRRRGLDVGEMNRSNYTHTAETLASMLQMRYLGDVEAIAPLIGVDGPHRRALGDAATQSPSIALLRSAGYEIITSPCGWIHTSLAAAADRVLDHGELTNLERTLIERTWLLDLVDLVWPAAAADSQRSRIAHDFADLTAFASTHRDQPAFFFSHVPAPHLPLVVEADGTRRHFPSRAFEATSPEAMGISRPEYVAAWRGELEYLNRQVLDAVDALQAAPLPPVIIVMSDHGYVYESSPDDMQSRFGNFFAADTPGAGGLLADAPTPVNLLPILFNHYLGTDLPLSPDRYFIAPSDERTLLLTEVPDPERVPAD